MRGLRCFAKFCLVTYKIGDVHPSPLTNKLEIVCAIALWEMGIIWFALNIEKIWWAMWVSKNYHWCCILKIKPDQNLFDVFLLINMNCLGEFIPRDVQTNIYLRVSFSDVNHSFHFIANVNNFIYLNVACNFVVNKYVKNKKEGQYYSHTQKDRLLMKWDREWWKNCWTYGSKPEKIVWVHKMFSPIDKLWRDVRHQQNWATTPKRFPCQFHRIRMLCTRQIKWYPFVVIIGLKVSL